LRCLSGLCGGSIDDAALKPPPPADPTSRQVVKPIQRVDDEEDEKPSVSSLPSLAERLNLTLAPPGAVEPIAVSTGDLPRNVNRLLVLLPSPGAPPGAWDTSVRGGDGFAVPIFRWAEANGFAACLFSSAALEADPTETWDRVLRGSPAGSVLVLAAAGSLPMLARILKPVHPLLYSRFRLALAPFEGAAAWPPAWPADLPMELVTHLAGAVLRAPASWAAEEPRSVVQSVFELLASREGRLQRLEEKKYAGFQTLKENDMPGMKRLGVEDRIKRLDRDRGNDELARLLGQHEHDKFDDDELEPGVD